MVVGQGGANGRRQIVSKRLELSLVNVQGLTRIVEPGEQTADTGHSVVDKHLACARPSINQLGDWLVHQLTGFVERRGHVTIVAAGLRAVFALAQRGAGWGVPAAGELLGQALSGGRSSAMLIRRWGCKIAIRLRLAWRIPRRSQAFNVRLTVYREVPAISARS